MLQQLRPLMGRAEIGRHRLVAIRMRQLPAQALQGAGPTTVQQQMGTLGRQFMGQGFTNAATGASQQYAFAFKLHWQDPVS